MSNPIANFLRKYPLLVAYAQKGLINFTALSRLIKENSKQIGKSTTLAALGMNVRRTISKLPKAQITPIDFSKYPLQLVTRTNICELVLNKNFENRKRCLNIVNKISQTKYFISIVEGEKEIVVMTDHPLKKVLQNKTLKNIVTHNTENLGFISVNFPIELRLVPGVYNLITTSLVAANISIHSFHTIGGEILILVKNEDLVHAQETLQSLLAGNPLTY